MNKVICPICRTRTGVQNYAEFWYCIVCGVDYIDTDYYEVIE